MEPITAIGFGNANVSSEDTGDAAWGFVPDVQNARVGAQAGVYGQPGDASLFDHIVGPMVNFAGTVGDRAVKGVYDINRAAGAGEAYKAVKGAGDAIGGVFKNIGDFFGTLGTVGLLVVGGVAVVLLTRKGK